MRSALSHNHRQMLHDSGARPWLAAYTAALAKLTGYGYAVADEAAFRNWFAAAWFRCGGAGTVAVLTNPNTSTLITLTEVRSVATGDIISVYWDEGALYNDYTLHATNNSTVTHTYAAGANRVIVILNGPRITRITATVAGSTAFGGRVEDFTALTHLNVQGSNTLSGSVAGLTALTFLYVTGYNTVSGSVAGLTALTFLCVYGSNTLSGSVAALTALALLYVTGTNTLSDYAGLAAAATGLCFLKFNTLIDTTGVNGVLAGFWANRDAAKPRADRTIDLNDNVGSGAPSGQGIIDKAALQAYRSPLMDPTKSFWTVETN